MNDETYNMIMDNLKAINKNLDEFDKLMKENIKILDEILEEYN